MFKFTDVTASHIYTVSGRKRPAKGAPFFTFI